MYVLTNAQMRAADAYTIEERKIPQLTLMERAGVALEEAAQKIAPIGKIVCVCGGGNNGGDGFVCARILKEKGREVEVVFLSEKLSHACAYNKQKWEEIGGKIGTKIAQDAALIIDCLFGTGFRGRLDGAYEKFVLDMNELKKEKNIPVLAADIPSGLNGDNGLTQGACVEANETLCFGYVKTGNVLNDGRDFCGKVTCADIGISLIDGEKYVKVITAEKAKALLPKRKNNSHKGSFGKAAIVAGSTEYTGAAYLSMAACLRSGVGYTTLFVPKNILSLYALRCPEAILKSISDGDRYAFNEEYMRQLLGYDAIAYGMGMGESKEVANGAEFLLAHYTGKLLLDADGINSLAKYSQDKLAALFTRKKCSVVLTPHCKEFSRLTGNSIEEILSNPIEGSENFSKRYDVTLLLKGATSVITNGAQSYINLTGNSGQAKGGSGDLLSGLIVGLCASGLTAMDGAMLGGYVAGMAAMKAAEEIGVYALTASDCIQKIGVALMELSNYS